MNVTIPEKIGLKKKSIIIYGIIIFVCIVALLVAFYVQFYARIDLGRLVGINKDIAYGNKTEDKKEEIKLEFLRLFNNSIENTEASYNSKKEDESKNLVYTDYEKKEKNPNSYDIEVHIPNINIKSEIVDNYNKEINETFTSMTGKVLKSENRNVIYTVDYSANVQNGILSVIIHSNFKEGSKAQKVIIKTYNYDLRNNKEVSLAEVLNFENIDKQIVQEQINTEIKKEQQKVEDLEKLGYNIFTRDVNNDMYKVENAKEFYFTKDVIYIIYPYGNNSNTSEMDIIVL